MSKKAEDSTCVPLCLRHHGDYHLFRGLFREMDKYDRREWSVIAIRETRLLHAGGFDPLDGFCF